MDSRSDFEKLIEASEKRVFDPFCDYDPQQDSFFLFTRDGAKTAEQISGALKVFRSYDSEEFVGIEIRKASEVLRTTLGTRLSPGTTDSCGIESLLETAVSGDWSCPGKAGSIPVLIRQLKSMLLASPFASVRLHSGSFLPATARSSSFPLETVLEVVNQ